MSKEKVTQSESPKAVPVNRPDDAWKNIQSNGMPKFENAPPPPPPNKKK